MSNETSAKCKHGDGNLVYPSVPKMGLCRAHYDAKLRIDRGLPGWPDIDEDGNELPDAPEQFAINGRKHGEVRTYQKGCRCVLCKKAMSVQQSEYRAAHPAPRKPRQKKETEHGTWSGYNYGKCRCDECKDAARIKAGRPPIHTQQKDQENA